MRTFSFFIHHAGSPTPTLMFEIASDEATLEALAKKALADSPHRLAVEVCEGDCVLFSLDRNGASWTQTRISEPNGSVTA